MFRNRRGYDHAHLYRRSLILQKGMTGTGTGTAKEAWKAFGRQ
jgi:hypothetical protein